LSSSNQFRCWVPVIFIHIVYFHFRIFPT
jgi:hypothetical protein